MKICLLGYGYRSMYYIEEIMKNSNLELIGILVHKEEDINIIKEKHNIFSTTDYKDIISLKPDFVINTISKKVNTSFSKFFLNNKIPVLQETPLGINKEDIIDMYKYKGLYQIAEQYQFYPYITKIKELIDKIGNISEIIISYAHDYHAISIIRYLIGDFNKLTLSGISFDTPITRTKTRYDDFKDGIIKNYTTKNIIMNWDDVNIIYNFNSEEYRSTIRWPYIIMKGSRGEIINDICRYLDDNNNPVEIKIDGYASFDDNYPISCVLNNMIDFVKNGKEFYPIEYSMDDALISIHMNNFNDKLSTIEYRRDYK